MIFLGVKNAIQLDYVYFLQPVYISPH